MKKYIVMLTLLLLLLVGTSLLLPRAAYRSLRTMARILPAQAHIYSGPNFQLQLSTEDEDLAEFLLEELELRRQQLLPFLPDRVPKPILARVHASEASLQQALGGKVAGTLGAYYLGRLELLAPQVWLPHLDYQEALQFYAAEGPIVHELTHLLLDYKARSAYPLWFSEGLAQYWEWRLTDYIWTEAGEDWLLSPHTWQELEDSFMQLPAPLAYREALSMVTYLYELRDDGVELLLEALARGRGFKGALEDIWGMDLQELERGWQDYLSRDLHSFR